MYDDQYHKDDIEYDKKHLFQLFYEECLEQNYEQFLDGILFFVLMNKIFFFINKRCRIWWRWQEDIDDHTGKENKDDDDDDDEDYNKYDEELKRANNGTTPNIKQLYEQCKNGLLYFILCKKNPN